MDLLRQSGLSGQMTAKTAGFQRGDGHRITPLPKDGPTLAGILAAVPACRGSRFHQDLVRPTGLGQTGRAVAAGRRLHG